MTAIRHEVWIDAPIADVYALIGSAKGVSRWWDKQTEVQAKEGLVWEHTPGPEHGTVCMLVEERKPDASVKWRCISTHKKTVPASAWTDTTIEFKLSTRADSDILQQAWAKEIPAQTVLTFTHAGWNEQSIYFAFCNFAWADVLAKLVSK